MNVETTFTGTQNLCSGGTLTKVRVGRIEGMHAGKNAKHAKHTTMRRAQMPKNANNKKQKQVRNENTWFLNQMSSG
jgi:hypothetical protein